MATKVQPRVEDEMDSESHEKRLELHTQPKVENEVKIKLEAQPRVKIETTPEFKIDIRVDISENKPDVKMDASEMSILNSTIPQIRERLWQVERVHLPAAELARKKQDKTCNLDWPLPDGTVVSDEYGDVTITVMVIKERKQMLKTALKIKLIEVRGQHTTWSDEEYIRRFESGDMDYKHFSDMNSIVSLQMAYTRAKPGILPPPILFIGAVAAHMVLRWDYHIVCWDCETAQKVATQLSAVAV